MQNHEFRIIGKRSFTYLCFVYLVYFAVCLTVFFSMFLTFSFKKELNGSNGVAGADVWKTQPVH